MLYQGPEKDKCDPSRRSPVPILLTWDSNFLNLSRARLAAPVSGPVSGIPGAVGLPHCDLPLSSVTFIVTRCQLTTAPFGVAWLPS